jgi:Tol biopolymer transport system component
MRAMRGVALALVICGVAGLAAQSSSDAARAKPTGTIAFMRLIAGPVYAGRLFLVRADGSGLRPVTPKGTRVYAYAWSPDGKTIAYIDRRFSLWIVHPDGSGRRLLLPTTRLSSVGLSWSPDGTRIAIISPGSNAATDTCKTTVYTVRIADGRPRSLHAPAECDVAWSPRGDEIAYDRGGAGVWLIRPDGTGRRKIAPRGSGSLNWSADGAQLGFDIAFRTKAGETSRYNAFAVVNADGTRFHVVTNRAYTEYGEAWSPVGRRVLYGGKDSGIYVIDPDGGNSHQVTRDSPPRADWGALGWSPDGRSIVYTTGSDTNTDLYEIGADGRNKVQLTNTPDVDIDPSWVARPGSTP